MNLSPATSTPTAILSKVLNSFAFMFSGEEPPDGARAGRWWEATIAYRGPDSGTLRLCCTPELAALLAANLLGIDPQEAPAAAEAEDSVKEFMNVLCAQFVTAVHGPECAFDVGVPQIRQLAATPQATEGAEGNFTTIHVEGHTVRIAHEPGPSTPQC